MLAFLCISKNINPELNFEDIKEKDVVFILGDISSHLSHRILSEITGEKYSLTLCNGFIPFNTKSYSKGKIKIGGLSLPNVNIHQMTNFFNEHTELTVLLLDENPIEYPMVLEYIEKRQPKYVFFNSSTHSRSVLGHSKIIGLSQFTVERYYIF